MKAGLLLAELSVQGNQRIATNVVIDCTCALGPRKRSTSVRSLGMECLLNIGSVQVVGNQLSKRNTVDGDSGDIFFCFSDQFFFFFVRFVHLQSKVPFPVQKSWYKSSGSRLGWIGTPRLRFNSWSITPIWACVAFQIAWHCAEFWLAMQPWVFQAL